MLIAKLSWPKRTTSANFKLGLFISQSETTGCVEAGWRNEIENVKMVILLAKIDKSVGVKRGKYYIINEY